MARVEVILSETGLAEGLGEALRGLAVRAVEETLRLEAPRLEEVARGEGWPAAEEVEVGLTLTDDASIRELNRTYLGRDSATDVLAFFMGGPPPETGGPSPGAGGAAAGEAPSSGEPLLLGDVVVSLET
ncbi:MAG: rRNA maturation RNase YbeY, partial [Firmicutes bacterium]|nr:rRNA maturation RNase YbeY [Bacillota bacterium]